MSVTRLTAEFRINNVLTDATSVHLSDPTGTFGARRTDTNATVVADGTAMTRQSAGVYTYDLTDPATDLIYEWYAEIVYQGATHRGQFFTDGTPSVSGDYIDRDDLLTELGGDVLDRLSDLTGSMSDAEKLGVQQAAVTDAEAIVNERLDTDGVSTPTTLHPRMVGLIARKLAGWLLYNRPATDMDTDDPERAFFQAKHDWAMAQLDRMISDGSFSESDDNISRVGSFTTVRMARSRNAASSDEFTRPAT